MVKKGMMEDFTENRNLFTKKKQNSTLLTDSTLLQPMNKNDGLQR